jgi:hypothetical protein
MYIIRRTPSREYFSSNLDKYWQGTVTCNPWESDYPCTDLPFVRFWIAHDVNNLHVSMHCTEKEIRAEIKEHDGPVNQDSCMEFYFVPVDGLGYYNLEITPLGYLKFNWRIRRTQGHKAMQPPELFAVEPVVNREEGWWQLTFSVPYVCIRSMVPEFTGDSGTTIRTMLCKCGDLTSQPHFLTSYPIDLKKHPKPDFHVPEFFGKMLIE